MWLVSVETRLKAVGAKSACSVREWIVLSRAGEARKRYREEGRVRG
jgi:hypothetical protein